MNNKIEVLDCTIRDGGYINNWNFDKKFVRETYRALSKSGIDYVELGYHCTENYLNEREYGVFRFSKIEDIKDVVGHYDACTEVSLMVDYGRFELSSLRQYINSPVKLIRVAFHKNRLKDALKSALKIKDIGFKVSANFMGFSLYTKKEISLLMKLLKNMPLDYAYIADSYGSIFPDQLIDFLSPLLELKHIKWGFHPHNNIQMAFANTLAAVGQGISIVDSSIYGMGRGAGNLPTEILVAYLQFKRPQKYNVVSILNIIDRYYLDLKEKYRWGYDLPYMISGIYNCHPDYAKKLIDRKEYDIEDVWRILEILKSIEPVGFQKNLLEDILKKGLFGKIGLKKIDEKYNRSIFAGKNIKVNYLNRHLGENFLILANGSTLSKFKPQVDKFIEKYKPIIMGGNYMGSLFKPHYHAFNNKRRFVDYIDTIHENSNLLIGQHIPFKMVREYTDRDYEIIYHENVQYAPFDIKKGIISSDCRTIALLLVAVAIVMGAKNIYIVGLDGYMNIDKKEDLHFYIEKDETEDFDVLIDKHTGNLEYLKGIDRYLYKKGKEEFHILTPTNYKKFYKGIENYI